MWLLGLTSWLISVSAIVVARAFTTSQSALAHQKLFHLIFGIVESDTGEVVKFRHIHGSGFDTITADGHRGQALGKLFQIYRLLFLRFS